LLLTAELTAELTAFPSYFVNKPTSFHQGTQKMYKGFRVAEKVRKKRKP